MSPAATWLRAAPWVALLLSAACGGVADSPPAGPVGSGLALGSLAPDFALPDVNPASATYATQVAPRDALGAVSLWYFGWAT